MKCSMVISVLLLSILILTSCSQNSNPLYDFTEEIYSLSDLHCATEKQNYSSDDTEIFYTITNIGSEERCIAGDSECFTLQKSVDGKWKRVGTKTEHSWNCLALILEPNQTQERKISLEKYFNLPLEKGIYRISVEGIVSNSFEIL